MAASDSPARFARLTVSEPSPATPVRLPLNIMLSSLPAVAMVPIDMDLTAETPTSIARSTARSQAGRRRHTRLTLRFNRLSSTCSKTRGGILAVLKSPPLQVHPDPKYYAL
jgi:hypothetical protein